MKLPPYGRDLLALRDRGVCPDLVTVFYGDDCWKAWRAREARDSCLCMPAADYQPGLFDWEPVAGLPTDIVLLSHDKAQALAAEIAGWTAPVTVTAGLVTKPVETFLYSPACVTRLWSADEEGDYLARESAYWAALLADREARENHGRRTRPAAG